MTKLQDLVSKSEKVNETYVSALETILEMLGNDSLNSDELTNLKESIEFIFNNILEDVDGEFEDENLDEALTLKKTTARQRMKAKKYARSAAGKRAKKIALKKRKKYANKISRCKNKGKTFSLRTLTCIKSKKRK